MKIGVIAAAGQLGSKVVGYAIDRGMDVTAFVHNTPCKDNRVTFVRKSLFELTPKDISGFDALVSAYGGGFKADPVINRQAVAHLSKIVKGTGVHLLMVAGAGCLFADESEITYCFEVPDHPDFLKGISLNLTLALGNLHYCKDVDWTFVCPSLVLDSGGILSRDYISRTDRHVIINEDGNSYISYDDMAWAMVDSIENGNFKKQLVTFASRHGGRKDKNGDSE